MGLQDIVGGMFLKLPNGASRASSDRVQQMQGSIGADGPVVAAVAEEPPVAGAQLQMERLKTG